MLINDLYNNKKQSVAEGSVGAKPGWMLKQDPELAKKVKDSKRGHEAVKKYAGKPVPKEQGVSEEASPMIKPPANRFDNKQEAFDHAKQYGGKVFKSTYTDSNTGIQNIVFVVKKEQGMAEEYELAGVGVAYELGRRAYQERKTIRDNPYSATKEARKYDEWEKVLERGKHDANDAKLFRNSVTEQDVEEAKKKKKKKSSRAMGGYFFPGYGYYGSGESGEGGGDDGGGESANRGMEESMNDDELAAMAKKASPNAYISVNGKEVQKPENWDKPYTPPAFDAEKYQRDLTAKYPNIDELVAKAEQRRDINYDYAEGDAYYRGREAEQNYQKLKQIQRVIQGLNESLNRSHLP